MNDFPEIELAERNASRMSHMSDAQIRTAIASLKALLPMYRDSFKSAVAAGYADDLAVYRNELLRRACASFSLPMLNNLQMLAIGQAMRDDKITLTDARSVALCQELCDLGLMMGRPGLFVLTTLAFDVLEAAEDEAVNLLDVVRPDLNTVAALVCASINNSYAETLREGSEHQMEAAE